MRHQEQQGIMMTLPIVSGMDEKIGREEIWGKAALQGRFHQNPGASSLIC